MAKNSKRSARIQAINKQVIGLFREQNRHQSIVPMLYDELAYRPVILFMGINPSFSVATTNAFLNKANVAGASNVPPPCIHKTFLLTQASQNSKALKRIQRIAKGFYCKYFAPFHKVGGALGLSLWHDPEAHPDSGNYWEHIDLFFSRGNPPYGMNFIARQIDQTKELIKIIRPQNIVVANSEACKVMCDHKLIAGYDEKLGWGHLAFGSQVRVFFSGHWATGRLDNYTANIVAAYLRCHIL